LFERNLTIGKCLEYKPDLGWDNIPLNTVFVAQDDSVWAATTKGLWNFKNGKWTQYLPQLSGYVIKNTILSPDGSIWTSHSNTIYHFDDNQWSEVTLDHKVWSLAISQDGDLWASLYEGSEAILSRGVWRFDGNTWIPVPELSDEKNLYIITTSPSGTIWFISNRNVNYDHPGNIKIFDGNNFILLYDVERASIHDILTTPNGFLWLTAYSNLLVFDGAQLRTVPLPFPQGIVTSIANKENEICIGTDTQGIWCLDTKDEWHNYSRELPCIGQ